VAVLDCTARHHAAHECDSHSCHDEGQPGHEEHEPSPPCQHSICSFVKAEIQRIDFSNDVVAWFPPAAALDSIQNGHVAATFGEPICRADLSSTQLYVWHCALII
jgi:hypothetical protein